MPKRGENIRRRKDGRWEGRYICGYDPDTGKSKYRSVYGKTYKDVKEKMDKAKYKTSQGIAYCTPSKIHFGKCVQEWYVSKTPSLKISSQNKYRQLIEKHILPDLGHLKTCEITDHVLLTFLITQKQKGDLRSKGQGLSDSSMKTITYILKSVLHYCQKQGYIDRNISIDTAFHMDTKPEISVLSSEDQTALDNYLAQNPTEKNLGIMFGLYCGLRVGEVCALKWEDVDLQSGIIHIRKTVQRIQNVDESIQSKTILHVDSPKSIASMRTIPLPSFLQRFILTHYPSVESQAYIMNNSKKVPIDPRTMQYHFKKVLQIIGVTEKNFHALRHTFATKSIMLGFDIKTLSRILGHANVNITLNKYVHPSMDQMKAQMNYWNNKKGHIYGQGF